MYPRSRLAFIPMVLFTMLASAAPLSAQSVGAPSGGEMSLGDICQIVGGAAALGFGLWHFAVPDLYRWWSYAPDAPASLVSAVDATNFFFSFSLSLIGATSIAMPFMTAPTEPVSRYWLWANAGLWTTRVVYQLVKPQGSHSPALQWGMLSAFVITDALFILSACLATF
jgi:hypothetical protein